MTGEDVVLVVACHPIGGNFQMLAPEKPEDRMRLTPAPTITTVTGPVNRMAGWNRVKPYVKPLPKRDAA